MATAVRQIEPQAEAVSDFFVFDIETRTPEEDVVTKLEAEFIANWKPPKNYKDPEAIERKRAEDLMKWRDELALEDAAPVAMVGLMFEDRTYLLHGVGRAKPKWFGKRERNVSIEGFPDEKRLMEAVYAVLNDHTHDKMQGVGHNIFGFDLGKIRLAGVRNGLTLPDALRVVMDEDEDRRRYVDTMTHYCKYFSRRGEMFIKQEVMLDRLGLENLLKGVATGADVPRLLEAGKVNEVATKLLADLVGVREAFLRMTGRELPVIR